MPFSTVNMPSSGLSVLKPYLNRNGFDTKCFHYQVEFANIIGKTYLSLGYTHPIDIFIPRWCFSRMAFPDSDVDRLNYEMYQHMARFNFSILEMCKIRQQAEEFTRKISHREWDKFDIVGFTVNSINTHAALAAGRLIKQNYPETLIVYGGNSLRDTEGKEYCKHLPWVDYVVIGQGERAMVELLQKLNSNKNVARDNYSLSKNNTQVAVIEEKKTISLPIITKTDTIPGIICRNENGDIEYTPQSKLSFYDVLPDFSEYLNSFENSRPDIKEYISKNMYVPVSMSHGCFYGNKKSCQFCSDPSLSLSQYAKASLKQAVAIMKSASECHPNPKTLELTSSILPNEYVPELFDEWSKIDNNSKLSIMHVPWFTKDHFSSLHKSGVKEIYLGIEQVQPDLVKLMKKSHTVAQSLNCLKWGKHYGIYIAWMLLIRVPKEREEWYYEVAATMRKIKHFFPPRHIQNIEIMPDTPYWNSYVFDELRPCHKYSYIYPSYLDLNNIAWKFDYNDDYYKFTKANSLCHDAPPHHKLAFDAFEEWTNGTDYKLEFIEHNEVFDNRNGEKTWSLTDAEMDILFLTEEPVHKNRIKDKECEINSLLDKDLLFFDGSHYISLVCD